MRNNIFDVFLNSVCKCYIENFCVYVHQGNWPIIFGIRAIVAFLKAVFEQ